MANLIDLTDETYDEVIKTSDLPVMVDFWAFWCGPCKTLAPILESVQNELEGQVKITKLDVEKFPAIAEREAVRSFPTLIVYLNGEEHSRIVGVKPRQYLLNLLQTVANEGGAGGQGKHLYDGLTIHDALLTAEPEAVEAVLKADPSAIGHRNADRELPLRVALKARQVPMIPILLEADPELEFVEYVALNRLEETCEELDRDPSLIKTYFDNRMSILELAALWGASDTLTEILRRSPPLFDLSEQKQAELLKMAVYGLSVPCIDALFEAGLNFHEDENMPLVAMAVRPQESRDSLDVIKTLIEKGANPNPVVHGKTVPEIVKEIGWSELVPELEALIAA